MHFVYKINNRVNGKVYVGQTNYPELRWSQHRSNAKYVIGNQVITRAMTKYEIENFDFEVIASCKTMDDVNLVEREMIVQYDSRNPAKGYNVDIGGGATERAPEIGLKIFESLKKHYETHDSKRLGTTCNEQTKKLMSESAMGKDGTNTGKTFDDSWRMKIVTSLAGSENKKLRRFTDEQELEICRLYVELELSAYCIAKNFNCQRTTIADIILRAGIPVRQSSYTGHSNGCNKFTNEQELEICQDYKTGKYSRADLSKKYNCGKTTIRDILLRNNIDLKLK